MSEIDDLRNKFVKEIISSVFDYSVSGSESILDGVNEKSTADFKTLSRHLGYEHPSARLLARYTAESIIFNLFDFLDSSDRNCILMLRDHNGNLHPINEGIEDELAGFLLSGGDDDPGWLRQFSKYGSVTDDQADLEER